jgi:preprotein translocase subunit SecF
MQQNQTQTQEKKSWYDKSYKLMFILPVIVMIISLIYLGIFYSKHNDFINKDVSLSGGTTITLTGNIDANLLETELKKEFSDINFRELTDITTGKQISLIIQSSSEPETLKAAIEKILGYNLTEENSSMEYMGPTLSQSFYLELLKIVFLSFILMALVIFFIFGESKLIKALSLVLSLAAVKLTFSSKNYITALVIILSLIAIIYAIKKSKNKKEYLYTGIVSLILILAFIFPLYKFIFVIATLLLIIYLIKSLPSIAVIFAAFSDILMALTIINLFEIKLSAAGLAAFLMLIGYSVDTDILLTTRAIKHKENTLNSRIYSSFKTGILMTLTALAAILPAFFVITGLPDSFRQIFLILALGLSADIVNTWFTNASIIKWYCMKKGIS